MTALSRFIVLIGPRGSGKTTLGHALARLIDSPFYDTDRMVESMAGETIQKLWERGGESLFREKESLVLSSLASYPRGVVSTGGGIILSSENRRVLSGMGPVFYLHVPVENLVGRLQSQSERRPRLKKDLTLAEEIHRVVAEREPFYRSTATHVIEVGSNPIAQVADEILTLLPAIGRVGK